ncbi:MAG TPA: Obg family GTPase CgtA, partial [Acidimicrobiales bacterium]|nr:Obg family GTPase CgtA [Acidimicrobiales bacterium]
AKPKIADYPFTTLEPNLGVVRLNDADFVVADVPGLIEGASEGRGLGHRFLRHVERARVLLVLLDLASVDGREPAEQLRILLDELGRYRPELLGRPRLVVGSKADAVDPDSPPAWDGLRVSSIVGDGLPEVLGRLATLVKEARDQAPPAASFALHTPEPEGVRIERGDDGSYVVLGRPAARAVAVNDLTNADALALVHHRLKQLGVDRALVRAGVREGDLVRIGGFAFEYEPD